MDNLNDILQRFRAHKVECVLIGGFAAVVHGVTLVTRDVDLCCKFSAENLMRIQSALADLHPMHRSRPDLPLRLTPEQCASPKNLFLKTDLGVVDCLSEVLGIGNYEEVKRNTVLAELPFGQFRVLDIDALIRAKEAMNRDQDRLALRQLKAIKERSLKHSF